jgi:hypothetical protein
MSSKPVVVIPRCETCNGKFRPKEKVFCVECNAKIHYDCAVYEYDDSNEFMLCLDCYKNSKIEKALERDGILVRVEGDDDCRAFIGKSFWDKETWDKELHIHDDCEIDLEVEEIYDDDACKFCGWRSEYEQSHIDYGNWNCSHIVVNYDLKFDEDGNLEWTKKEQPDCAFGYCCEKLYNRGCLKGYEKLWNCDECKVASGIVKIECCRINKAGEKCDESALYNAEYCRDCMKIESGMYNEDE